jgi:hypothetical protein
VNPAQVPEEVVRLLWDIDVADFDLDRDRALVFERVMSRGTWTAMKWLRQRYPRAVLAEFVRSRGPRVLAPRDLAYWALVCDVDLAGGKLDVGGGRPRWAGA